MSCKEYEAYPQVPKKYLEIPKKLNMAYYACDRWVEEGRGDSVAIYLEDQKITWAELQIAVNQFGNALKKLGVQKGDRFIIRLHNTPEYYAIVLGGLKIGAVPIPTSSLFRAKELEHLINNSGSLAAVSTAKLVGPIEEVKDKCETLKHIIVIGEAKKDQIPFESIMKGASPELNITETRKDDPAFMLYTSGTTGLPKGIAHAHRWLIATGDPIAKMMMALTPNDICFSPQEISFMYPFGCNFFYPFYCGAAVVLYPGRFDPEKVFKYIERYKATVFVAVPTIYRRMLAVKEAEKKYNLSSIKRCISSGETISPETYEEWKRRFGCEIFDGLGQTEIHIFCCELPGMKVKPGSMGKPFPGFIVKVLNDKGKECPPEKTGHVAIREDNPGLFYEYRGMPKRWAETHRAGWYYTGDLAYVDEDGYFWYVSRSDDLIKSRAYLIGPKEVEDVILEKPAVLEAAVIGAPDPIMGQRVKAFVILRPGYEPSKDRAEEIRLHVRNTIAPYKAPKEIEFIDQLPKTATGKILRRELRRIEKERYRREKVK